MNTDNLIELREDLGMTQEEFAKTINYKRSAYSLCEEGKNIIKIEILNMISNKYEKSIDFLCGISRKNFTENDYKYINLNKKQIGTRLKEIRKKYNLKQKDIAKKLNTTQSSISAYENGNNQIKTIFLIGYAIFFNTSIDYICGKTNEASINHEGKKKKQKKQ